MVFNRIDASRRTTALLADETRWHYSQHFLAEIRGEEVLEDIARLVPGRKERNILASQLQDEMHHVALFKKALSRIGVDTRASRYADGYSALVKTQQSVSEKIFAFQILTEAVSAAYCAWRLEALVDDDGALAAVDDTVFKDEIRHLDMGRSLLAISDRDERAAVLTDARKRELLRAMNDICRDALDHDLVAALVPDPGALAPKTAASQLDLRVSRAMVREARQPLSGVQQ